MPPFLRKGFSSRERKDRSLDTVILYPAVEYAVTRMNRSLEKDACNFPAAWLYNKQVFVYLDAEELACPRPSWRKTWARRL